MKKHILNITSVLLLIFAYSCDSYLDVNNDPNVLGDTDEPKIILPVAEVGLANTLMGWDLGFAGGYWSEYWTQNYTASQFKVLCEYEDGSVTSFENAYEEFTSGILIDTKRISELASANGETGYVYISEALSIFTWQVMVDLWGDIPYFEALRGSEGITSPVFDDQEVIYDDLEVRIDDLLATDISTLSEVDADFDFVFGGDLTKWEQFANSLKLKIMMRQSETSEYDNSAVITFINSASFLTTESAKIEGSEYWSDSEEGKRHPMREFQEGGANYLSTNVIGCKTFIDYLKVNSDPRLETLFTPIDDVYEGAFFGDFDSTEDSDSDGIDDDSEDYCEAYFAADTDLIIISAWEVNFFIAEAYARANDLTTAKTYYDAGVAASLAQNDITDTAIITTGYATWVDGTTEENIEQIALQKWVANANYQNIESFIDRNRTKYPSVSEIDVEADRQYANDNFPIGSLTVSVNGREKTNGFVPVAPIYPTDVLNRNINAPGQKANLLEKVWWNQKAGK